MLKVGMIGCGGISRAHAAGWKTIEPDRARVVATADIDEARAKERAEELGADDVYTDYRKLLQRDDIDAVDICLPHNLHAEATIAAAERGKHVLCEKPIARNLEEARSMIETCKKNGRILQIGHQNRFDAEFARYKELLDELDIGRVSLVHARYEFFPNLKPFHYKKDAIGGGVFISTGIHTVDLARWFFGDVKKIALLGNNFTRGTEGEDTSTAIVEYASGAVGTITISWAAKFGGETSFVAFAEKGSLKVVKGRGITHISETGTKTYEVKADVNAMAGEISHFVECILENKTPLTSGEEGYKALQIALAAYESLEQQKVVTLK